MNLLAHLKKISKEYSGATSQDFKGHPLAAELRNGTRKLIPDYMYSDAKYLVKGSAGMGKWAEVPWIGIFDRSISTVATEGAYIVFLFTNDYKGVYLSLNQGWSYFANTFNGSAINNIRQVSNYWQGTLTTLDAINGFTMDPINLNTAGNGKISKNGSLAYGYEKANIYSKYYDLTKFSNNHQLMDDLSSLKVIFSELKSKLIRNSYKSTINYILNLSGEYIKQEQKEKNSLSLDPIEIAKKLVRIKPPEKQMKQTKELLTSRVSEDSIIYASNKNKKIEYLGKQVVLEYERNIVSKSVALKDYVNKVKLTLKRDGFYDIESYRVSKQGNPIKIYIQVMTTLNSFKTPFVLTNEQIKGGATHKKRYMIYRLFEMATQKPKFYVVSGPFEEKIDLKPIMYLVSP